MDTPSITAKKLHMFLFWGPYSEAGNTNAIH